MFDKLHWECTVVFKIYQVDAILKSNRETESLYFRSLSNNCHLQEIIAVVMWVLPKIVPKILSPTSTEVNLLCAVFWTGYW